MVKQPRDKDQADQGKQPNINIAHCSIRLKQEYFYFGSKSQVWNTYTQNPNFLLVDTCVINVPTKSTITTEDPKPELHILWARTRSLVKLK